MAIRTSLKDDAKTDSNELIAESQYVSRAAGGCDLTSTQNKFSRYEVLLVHLMI